MGLGAHDHTATTGAVAVAHAGHAVDNPGSREVRRRDDFNQIVDRAIGIAQYVQGAIDDFSDIVRRDIGRHTDRDAGRTIDQQVRDTGRQYRRLSFLAIVVRYKIDRIFFDIGQNFARDLVQAALGVTHRRSVVAVDRTKVTLSIHQRITHRKVLRHANQGVVNRLVAVRVVFTHDFTDYARALHVGAIPYIISLMHRVQNPAMHRLQAIAHIRQRAPHNHTHRVIEVALAHFFFEGNRNCFFSELIHWRFGWSVTEVD